MSVVLLSNNPRMHILAPGHTLSVETQSDLPIVQTALEQAKHTNLSCFLFDSSAISVLTAARDLIHSGWKLLHHPLYGNFRPHQQPYRSLLLHAPSFPAQKDVEAALHSMPDMASLHYIEEAFTVYRESKVLSPADAPTALQDACSLLDFELMRLPLEQVGCLPGSAEDFAPGFHQEVGKCLPSDSVRPGQAF